MNIFLKRVPLYIVAFAAIFGALISYSFITLSKQGKATTFQENATPATVSFASSCNVNFSRLSGRKYIKPLLFAERTCEADKFMTIRNSLSTLINDLKTKGDINSASVYIRLFQKGEWMSLNDEIKYQPGSLFKVPLLITYLRLAEHDESLLNKKLLFNQITTESKGLKQEFVKERIKLGNYYTVKELFRYMIVHSDNNATMLLMNNIPFPEFTRTFTDVGLSKDLVNSDAAITAHQYSLFWLALYNGSYLNFDNSDYALSLLSECDFKEGLLKGIPQDVKVAHKFGEKGDLTNHAFHETGIVYIHNSPYLITVMTQGSNQTKLPNVLKEISAIVYQNMDGLTN
jgi:beta-lactamase class A